MVFVFSLREAAAKVVKTIKVLLILVVFLYLLSQFVSLCWDVLHGPPVPSEPVVESPLRVSASVHKFL